MILVEKGRIILRNETSGYINANFLKVCSYISNISFIECFPDIGIQARQSFHCSTVSHENYN